MALVRDTKIGFRSSIKWPQSEVISSTTEFRTTTRRKKNSQVDEKSILEDLASFNAELVDLMLEAHREDMEGKSIKLP